MKLIPFKCKLFKPCKKLLHLFKFRLHKPVFIRALQSQKPKVRKTRHKSGILSVLRSLRRTREMDRVTEINSFTDSKAPYSSPLTPAYIRLGRASGKEVPSDGDDVEDACRSFEKYLVEMIVDEGKMRDLVDIEELLHCWKNLTSPVFIDLVSRFYGELCKDLFSNSCENDKETSVGLPM